MIILNKNQILFCFCVTLFALSTTVQGQQPTTESPTPYVSVNLEIKGLEESTKVLNDAVLQLSETMNEISKSPQDLSVEQIEAVTTLAQETNTIVQSIEKVLSQLPDTINSLSEPTSAAATKVALSIRQNTIDPMIQSVDRKVSVWIRMIVIGLIIILSIVGFVILRMIKRLREVTDNIRLIANEYTIVRREEQA